MPLLLRFYDPTVAAPGPRNSTLNTILAWPDAALEYHHDYIQTLFPLPEPSPITSAPLVTPTILHAFRSSAPLRAQLLRALARLLAFYGLRATEITNPVTGGGVRVVRAANWDQAKRGWVTRFNHNHLRMTRILRSLRVLGLGGNAEALWGFLREDEEVRGRVGERTIGYWRRASERPLHLAPDEDDEGAVGVVWLRGVE